MSVIITPAKQTLKQKAKIAGRRKGGISREEAVALGGAVLDARLDEARTELGRLVGMVRRLRDGSGPVKDDHHALLKAARELADTGGTFWHHAMTEVARSLEGYLIALTGTGREPEASVVTLHAEALAVLLGQDARGALGDGERQLVDGLIEIVAKTLNRPGTGPAAN